jgi:putative Mg2+ transporter-C (MgtC) family protein
MWRFLVTVLGVGLAVGLVVTVFDLVASPPLADAPWVASASRLLLALALSVAVGAERELRHKPAGLRTVTMVGLGSCLFTLAGTQLFVLAPDSNAMSRLIQGIVTGIGFLGAGTIIREHEHVEGLTTAATVWAVAGVGLACGLGEFGLAIIGTAAILLVLVALPVIERAMAGGKGPPESKAQ